MKFRIGIIAALCIPCTAFPAQAKPAAVVLDVHHAGCLLCGPIVKNTLGHIKGVTKVSVSQADGNADVVATVSYDNAQTSPAAMIRAATAQGYPAEISKHIKG